MGLGSSKNKQEDELKKEVEKLKDEAKQKDARIAELMSKYSDQMHTDVTANESKFENVSISNRPMKLADEYTNFCTDAWLDAKQDLDDSKETENMDELDKIKLLCNIIVVAGEEAKRLHDDLWLQLTLLLNEPVQGATKVEQLARKSMTTPQKMQNMIGDHFRTAADKIDVQSLVDEVSKRAATSVSDKTGEKALQLKQVKLFVEQAVRISWKMALQRPAMTFKTPEVGKAWKVNSDKYKLEAHYGSDYSHKEAVIHSYVHPILYHGDAIMGRAKVMVGPPGMKFEND